ncbi:MULTISPECIES: STAS/SEC14 domain-containing protein [Hymenobacter]|uniref:STAS/SEC14 domain-containing protein n=1 Tax=Hymenobacter jejuensis TaxID=2502781 RepID=A0A5B8A5T5_9BACT|nr:MULTISPECIES: STAS/SEC14 domain-containing protein [Hymenobacter]MBC6990022.1 hypothetical protein [Hymenobacter sp. BT491]QDA62053.1 hypothetical protein FHG12_18960 [Hymenobacter jejuensis]
MADLLYPTDESLYFHNELASVIEHPAKFVRIEWQIVPVRSSEFRMVYEQVLALLKNKGYTKVLTDHRSMPPILPEDKEWLARCWAPRAVHEGGYKRCAVVQTQDSANYLYTKHITHAINHLALEVGQFEDQQAAVRWLCCA